MTTQPNNLRKNALGHFVPESLIAPLDLLRDDLVTRLCNEAHEEKLRLLARKASIAQEIEAFMDLSAAEYGVQYGGTKGGHVDVNQVLSLRKLEIQDVEWKEAMKAIADAITVVGKAEYIRFYEKTDNGGYKAIVIDWSKL